MQAIRPEDITLFSCSEDKGVPVGRRYGPTIRTSFIIECCTAGEARHLINGKAFPLSAGGAIVFFPGDTVIHETCGTEPRCGYWCCASGTSIETAFRQAGLSSTAPYLPPDTAQRVTALLQKMCEMRRENDGGAEWRRKGLLLSIVGEILRKANARPTGSVYVDRALGVMESRYSEDLTVEEISREVGLERSYFSTLFRRETGQSPKAALTNLRLRRAAALLRETEIPIADVASACGIPAESFSRVFRAKKAMTPLNYRRKHRT